VIKSSTGGDGDESEDSSVSTNVNLMYNGFANPSQVAASRIQYCMFDVCLLASALEIYI
jgi:hypothetical protein